MKGCTVPSLHVWWLLISEHLLASGFIFNERLIPFWVCLTARDPSGLKISITVGGIKRDALFLAEKGAETPNLSCS